MIIPTVLLVYFCAGSLVKKSKAKGIKVEVLKLPAVTDFAAGTSHVYTLYMYTQCRAVNVFICDDPLPNVSRGCLPFMFPF